MFYSRQLQSSSTAASICAEWQLPATATAAYLQHAATAASAATAADIGCNSSTAAAAAREASVCSGRFANTTYLVFICLV